MARFHSRSLPIFLSKQSVAFEKMKSHFGVTTMTHNLLSHAVLGPVTALGESDSCHHSVFNKSPRSTWSSQVIIVNTYTSLSKENCESTKKVRKRFRMQVRKLLLIWAYSLINWRSASLLLQLWWGGGRAQHKRAKRWVPVGSLHEEWDNWTRKLPGSIP